MLLHSSQFRHLTRITTIYELAYTTPRPLTASSSSPALAVDLLSNGARWPFQFPGHRSDGGGAANASVHGQRPRFRAGGGARSAGGDRVRRLDGGHGQQQPDQHAAAVRLPALRPRHAGRGARHGPVRQRPTAAGLYLRGARPAAARAGVPRPGLRHQGLRARRLLRLRRHRTRQRHRRRPVSDPAVEGGGVLQGVPAAAARLRRARARQGHRPRRAPRGEHRHQRLPGELLHARHRPVRGVHGGRVPGLPRRRRAAVPDGDPPPGRAPGHLRRARRHRLPPARAHHQRAPRRRLHRGVQPGGQGLQRQDGRHAAGAPRRVPQAQPRPCLRLRQHGQPRHQPVQIRAGERGGGVLRDGQVRDGVHVQRRGAVDVRGRRQVPLLGRIPSYPEGQQDHGTAHARRLLPTRHLVMYLLV